MNQFEMENAENQMFLTYTLDESASYDSLVVGMMENNSIPGLIPFHIVQMNQMRSLRYDIQDMCTLEDQLDKLEDGRKLLLLVKSIADAVCRADDFMIEEHFFVLEMGRIYIDSKFQAQLICLPVEQEAPQKLREFCITLFELPQVIQQLGHYAYTEVKAYLGGEHFSAGEFSEFLADLELRSAIVVANPTENGVARKSVVLGKRERMGCSEGTVKLQDLSAPVILTHNADKQVSMDKTVFMPYEERMEETVILCDQDETAFLASYSVRVGYLIRKKTREQIKINLTEFQIGKSSGDNDYCIMDNPTISRHHAKIVRRDADFFIIDLNSKNHTYLDGKQIECLCEVPLSDQMSIRMANEEFEFKII